MAATTTTRRLVVAGVVALVVCVLAAISTYQITVEHPVAFAKEYGTTRAVAGRTYTGFADDPAPRVSVVRVPDGWLHLEVSRRFLRVEGDESASLDPPAGGSFVGVESGFDTSRATVPRGTEPTTTTPVVSVLTGGKRYPVGTQTAHPTVAIPGAGSDVRIEVSFDGVTQTLDVASGRLTRGRAAPLYAAQPTGSHACGTARIAAPYSASPTGFPLSCRLDWQRVPWLHDLGWAKAGQAWLLVAISTQGPAQIRRGAATYGVSLSDAPMTVTCDSSPAAVAVRKATGRVINLNAPPNHDRDQTAYAACPVPAAGAAVRVGVSERLQAYSGGGDSVPSPSVSWTVTAGS